VANNDPVARPMRWMRYPDSVPAISPTLEGFRAAFRRPAVSFAELAWRWTVGATAIILFFFGAFQYFATLPVTGGELLFLRTKHPILVAQALAHILRGGWSRAVSAALLAMLAMLLLWMVGASLGRMATVRALLDYFRRDTSGADSEPNSSQTSGPVFRSMLRLNFLRLVVGIATISGIIGAGILGSFASSDSGLSFLIWFFLALLIAPLGWILNWFLSLASLFPVRDGDDAIAALSAALSLCRERAGALFAVSFWTGLTHIAAFFVVTSVVFMPLALLGTVPWRVIALAIALITLVYFAVADWIYIARLAGYVCIVQMPDAPPVTLAPSPDLPPPTPIPATIDQDELILSDLPNLAPES
jgi:hypothetical protein